MPPRGQLLVCPHCACHAKLMESRCPCCGTIFSSSPGAWLTPAAAIVAMGLSVATCSEDVTTSGTSSGGGMGGMGGMGPTTSQTTDSVSSAYTAATTSGPGGFGGEGGVGGAGGAGGAGGN